MPKINSLFAGYGKKEVLHNISLEFEKGKITTIIGPNGCGKSTLLKSIVGLADVISGEIDFDNSAKHVAYLAQSKSIPDITVGALVLHGRFPYISFPRHYSKKDLEIADSAMEKMGILHLKDVNLETLSGGIRQKAYIAMALCQQTEIVLMDEPVTYLDISQKFKLTDILNQLKRDGKTVICVLHDIILSLKISDNIIVMNNGTVKVSGTPEQILKSGTLAEVFGIEIVSTKQDNVTEYFYRQGKELQ